MARVRNDLHRAKLSTTKFIRSTTRLAQTGFSQSENWCHENNLMFTIQTIELYLHTDVAILRILATITVAYVVKEEQMEYLRSTDDIFVMIINQLLVSAIASNTRRWATEFCISVALH